MDDTRPSSEEAKKERDQMPVDLEKRERAVAAAARAEEREIAERLKNEIERVRERHSKGLEIRGSEKSGDHGLQRPMPVPRREERMLDVSFDNANYTGQGLKGLFSHFGEVEEVIITMPTRASVVMATKKEAYDAMGELSGSELKVSLVEIDKPNLTAEEFTAFEKAVLKKVQKAAEKQRNSNGGQEE